MIYQNASHYKQAIINGETPCRDVVEAHQARIDRHNPRLNAIVCEDRERVLNEAKQLDRQRTDGSTHGPLFGVPVTVKECFHMREFCTTVNYPPLKNYRPSQDSILVQRLREAGAIILGKTNVPTLLADTQTFGPLFPTCNNPYDTTRTSGGSTGGGAAAVAAGMSTIEIGSDIAGSIRNPSHYCGLFGLKPTQNGHVQDGHVPPLPNRHNGYLDMNSTGPLARTMSDIELAYQVCYAPRWDYQRYLPVTPDMRPIESLAGLNIATYDSIIGIEASQDVRTALETTTQKLRSAGANVTKIKLDHHLSQRILRLWVKLFGFVIGQDFNWPMRQLLKLKFGMDLKGSRLDAQKELKDGLSLDFRQFSMALREQQECTAELLRLFKQYDFLMGPTSMGPAFEHNPKHKDILVDGERVNYADYCFGFVMPFNATRLPVLAIPAGQTRNGLPVGLSVVAPHYCEDPLIRFGHLVEASGCVFTPPEACCQ